MIEEIAIEKLKNHPANVRRNYENLDELFEIFTGEQIWNIEDDEKKQEMLKEIAEYPIAHCLLATVGECAKTGSVCDWYEDYDGEEKQEIFDFLKWVGFTFVRDDDEEIIYGTHPLYEKEED